MKTIEKLGAILNKNGFVTALAERLKEAFADGSGVNDDTKVSLLRILMLVYQLAPGGFSLKKWSDVMDCGLPRPGCRVLQYQGDEEGGEVADMIDEISRDLGDHATDWPDVPPLTSLLDSSIPQSKGRFSF